MKLTTKYGLTFLSLLIFFSVTVHVQANPGPSFIGIFMWPIFPFLSMDSSSNEMIFIAKYHGNDEVSYQWESYLLIDEGKSTKIVGPKTQSWTLRISMPTIVKVTARNERNPFDFDVAVVKVTPKTLASLSTSSTFTALR